MEFKENTVVYVGCPAFNKTGGTELAHQLVKAILDRGKQAKILYYDVNEVSEKNINPAFKKYVSTYEIISNVRDDAKNILIAPEIKTEILNHFNNIQKSIWWMSVDNYTKLDGFLNCKNYFGFLRAVKYLLQGKITFNKKRIDPKIDHLYQSEYARLFLLSNGITRSFELSDYLNDTYLDYSKVNYTNRKNVVLYNPRKGFSFTKKLIAADPDIRWKPIENLTTEQVRKLLLESKVYIDFGNHPGKDRFPREAAISGCCIITDKTGSAKNNIDINIPYEYKFENSLENVDAILTKIRECLRNYERESKNFDDYRKKILGEKSLFLKNVDDMISGKYN